MEDRPRAATGTPCLTEPVLARRTASSVWVIVAAISGARTRAATLPRQRWSTIAKSTVSLQRLDLAWAQAVIGEYRGAVLPDSRCPGWVASGGSGECAWRVDAQVAARRAVGL